MVEQSNARPLKLLDTSIGLGVAGFVVLMGAILVDSLRWYAALSQIGITFLICAVILGVAWWYYD